MLAGVNNPEEQTMNKLVEIHLAILSENKERQPSCLMMCQRKRCHFESVQSLNIVLIFIYWHYKEMKRLYNMLQTLSADII